MLKKTFSGVKGLAQGAAAVMARVRRGGGFHTHACMQKDAGNTAVYILGDILE